MNDYHEFLASKRHTVQDAGFKIEDSDINLMLYPFQRDIVKWAIRKGRGAIFAGTGMGKTAMYLEYSRHVAAYTGEAVLIVAPLGVALQTEQSEAPKFGIEVHYVTSSDDIRRSHIYITNYERLDAFDPKRFGAVVLDESSILKSFDGTTRKRLIRMFRHVPYRLCCSATPAPNNINEIGAQSEFLGIMSQQQMISTYFVHEAGVFRGSKTGGDKWRLKGHAKEAFYQWLASWAIAINHPSDIGYEDGKFNLPPLRVIHEAIYCDFVPDGMLPGFYGGNIDIKDANRIRRMTIPERTELVTGMVDNGEQWLIWCGLNDEAAALAKAIPGSRNVHGSLSAEEKAQALLDFQNGEIRVLITKLKIAGMGMNLQNSHNMIFFGLNYSWEGYYQGIRRQWRYGQEHPVNVTVITSQLENRIFEIVMDKEKEAVKMVEELIQVSREYTIEELYDLYHDEWKFQTAITERENWTMVLGDSADPEGYIANMPDESIDISIYSPPFSDMYVYNNTPRDLSNSLNIGEFMEHYRFIIEQNYRVTKAGRLCCVHVQNLKTFKNKEGYRGIYNFASDVIDAYCTAGWIIRSIITIDKNPQIAASRNKDTDLLFVTGKKDASNIAPQPCDYLLIFKKPGDNLKPITPYQNNEMNEDQWITWAHGVWYGIRETEVLNVRQARAEPDEKHMCPLQLPLIERCLKLWSNPGEVVFSPFAGIGSEGYEAIRHNRRFIGIELKPEYYEVACRNLHIAEQSRGQTLFEWAANHANVEAEKQ